MSGCRVTQIRLIREGIDPTHSDAVVSVLIDGQWVEVIRENLAGMFGHYVDLVVAGFVEERA